jgi:hypothetical protein
LAGPYRGDFWQYTTGIERAAELILESFSGTGRDFSAADTLVYPLGLLCRHLVELRLKELYLEIHGSAAPEHHDLLGLWRGLRTEIEQAWPAHEDSTSALAGQHEAKGRKKGRSSDPLKSLEKLIKAYHDLDKSGQRFRYPGSFKTTDPHVSLEKLHGVAMKISEELDGLHSAFYEENQARAEYQAEFVAEMQRDEEW